MLGPICFGKLIDDICIQWEKSDCSGTGSCRLYDNDNFRLKLYGYQTAFKGAGLIFIILAFIMAKVTKIFDVKDIDDKGHDQEMQKFGVDGDKEKIVK